MSIKSRRPVRKVVASVAMVAKKRATSQARAKKPSKEQARLWVQRLLPITLRHLDVEAASASERRWRWRHYNRRCENLDRVRDALGPRYLDTFEQYLRYRPALVEFVAAHDVALEKLIDVLSTTFDKLRTDPNFRAKAEASERSQGGESLSEEEIEHDIKQMAQHTINNVTDLLPSEPIAKIWATAREGLREVAGPDLRKIERQGESFGDAVRTLVRALREDQAVLADGFNIPVIDANEDLADRYLSFEDARSRSSR